MRQWSKSNISGVDNAVLRDIVQRQDTQLNELSAAMGLIKNNRQPSVITNQILGVTDHGQLTGLADDDHTQYLLLAGRGGQIVTDTVTFNPQVIAGGSGLTLTLHPTNITQVYNLDTTPLSIVPETGLKVQPSGANQPEMWVGGGTGKPTLPYESAAAIVSAMTGTKTGLLIANASSGGHSLQSWASATGSATGNVVSYITTAGLLNTPAVRFQLVTATGVTTLSQATGAVSHTLTLPATQGAAGDLLTQDGSGQMSWTGSPSVPGGLVLYYNSGTLVGGEFTIEGGAPAGYYLYDFPAGSGTVVVDALPTAYTLVLAAGTRAITNTSSNGFSLSDTTTSSKRLRFVLSGAAGLNALTINSTAARNYQTLDSSGTIPLVGNTTSAAGVLGKSDLTGQTGSIGSTTLLTGGTPTAGMYRVSAYLNTTTAGGGGAVVKMTVGWNDGAAQTADMPLISAGGGVVTNHDLTTLNAMSQGSIVLYSAASQNVTFTTTFTAGTGSPQYSIHVRIEALG